MDITKMLEVMAGAGTLGVVFVFGLGVLYFLSPVLKAFVEEKRVAFVESRKIAADQTSKAYDQLILHIRQQDGIIESLRSRLDKQVESLTGEVTSARLRHETLQAKYEDLRVQYVSLQIRFDDLVIDYNKLLEDYSRISTLEEKMARYERFLVVQQGGQDAKVDG